MIECVENDIFMSKTISNKNGQVLIFEKCRDVFIISLKDMLFYLINLWV